jgi:ribose 5-phosphate isomerase B
MAERRTPSAEEVRAIVRRIVDATGAGAPTPSPAPGPAASHAAAGALSTPAPAPTAAPGRETIAIGGDHGGYALKDAIGRMLAEAGYLVTDCGTNSPAAVDYPDIAHAVARLVADGNCRWGIVVDGAGIGSCMAANKVPGIRAALAYDLSSARNSREHNYANVLTLGARLIGEGLAIEIVRTWLGTNWGPARHAARVDKITEIERRYMKPSGEVQR